MPKNINFYDKGEHGWYAPVTILYKNSKMSAEICKKIIAHLYNMWNIPSRTNGDNVAKESKFYLIPSLLIIKKD